MNWELRKTIVSLSAVGLACGLSACSTRPTATRPETAIPLLGSPGSTSTSRTDLDRTIAEMDARVQERPTDQAPALRLVDALLRQTRVTGNAGLAMRAETVLVRVLKTDPLSYNARRMLGAVYLSQHRFREAIREAERCETVRTNDAWVYGVLGDAHLELGEYAEAFAAFDRMTSLRPDAASYDRASYARELQGDLEGAVRLMQMGTDATSAQDPESLAWHHAQLGHLYFELGRLADARREFAHADYTFPGHPFASDGLARIAAAEGHYADALQIVTAELATTPTPAAAALAGDLLSALGRRDEAEREYRLAEAAWRADAPEPSRLARFLTERGRHIDQAVPIAEDAEVSRRDIFTEDALAWAYFQSGQMAKARAASTRALRTGSRDRGIRYHAAAIALASGNVADARRWVTQALNGSPHFDLVSAPAAAALLRSLDITSQTRQ